MNIITKLLQNMPTSSMSNQTILLILIVSSMMIALSFGLKYLRRKTKNKMMKKCIREFPSGLMTFGILGLFLLWVRLESVPFLAMRLWWLFYWIGFSAWGFLKLRKISALNKRIKRFNK